jgi:hypothetical protein
MSQDFAHQRCRIPQCMMISVYIVDKKQRVNSQAFLSKIEDHQYAKWAFLPSGSALLFETGVSVSLGDASGST